MKTNPITSLTLAVVAVILSATELAYAEHQPRPDHADERLDGILDDRCPDELPGNEPSEGRACRGLEKANNAATK